MHLQLFRVSPQPQAISVLCQVLYASEDSLPSIIQELCQLHTSIRQEKAGRARQTTIAKFFSIRTRVSRKA